jgi:3-oxoacyl-[acyl-carrier protein] reductase
MLLKNKNAVIYGAGGAIGSAVASAFAREGARLFLAGRTLSSLDVVRKSISHTDREAEVALVDALDEQAVEKHLEEVVSRVGGLDISFNAVGLGGNQGVPLVELPTEEWTLLIRDILRTQFVTARTAARQMVRRGSGVILMITATPARIPIANSGSFGIACAAIEGLCRQLAGELGPQGVRVNCLRSAGSPDAPGAKEAFAIHAREAGMTLEEFVAFSASGTLLKRFPTLAEVANVAAFLASDQASAMTGTVANVMCGLIVD